MRAKAHSCLHETAEDLASLEAVQLTSLSFTWYTGMVRAWLIFSSGGQKGAPSQLEASPGTSQVRQLPSLVKRPPPS